MFLPPGPTAGYPSPDPSHPLGVTTGSLPLPRGWGGCPQGSRASPPPLKALRPWGEPRANPAEGQSVGTRGVGRRSGAPLPS